MPLPVAAVGAVGVVGGVVGGGVIAGVVAVARHTDHSDYDDHSDYSDAAERRRMQIEAKINEESEKLEHAKRELDRAINNAVSEMNNHIEAVNGDEQVFSAVDVKKMHFMDADSDLENLISSKNEKILNVVRSSFENQLKDKQKRLEEINNLLSKINKFVLTGKDK
ncbi:hypothetical protein LZ24_03107 [Desulfobotulus alkaliphilus]|uniref:Uncharacterized protein n=1 Tax=Desulfobotulus alkaliphilus TaxID=622671 RepID=A0A562R8Q5_9BACT|nr:hypothetical protein [Desulfobotulus alkaliphilus]TWI64800.1 hypothetical protein LZ24_03107 [Desulfobotulus alkaliphilus]